mmetsp:Transcript_42772/g.110287  ORF Transcript_42772/g.110287 Transcript_42772/m.110287 type:complete len:146 (+) Transcript_42772:903-1340(+)
MSELFAADGEKRKREQRETKRKEMKFDVRSKEKWKNKNQTSKENTVPPFSFRIFPFLNRDHDKRPFYATSPTTVVRCSALSGSMTCVVLTTEKGERKTPPHPTPPIPSQRCCSLRLFPFYCSITDCVTRYMSLVRPFFFRGTLVS